MLSKIFVDELNAPDVIPDPKVRVDQPLNIYQLATSFMAMAGGLTLGMLAFLVECCFFTGKIKREDVEEVCNITCHISVTYILQFPQVVKPDKDIAPKKDASMPSVEIE